MNEDRRARGLYWDQAWKLVEGCRKISPGCDNSWSEEETAMRAGHPNEKISGRALDVLDGKTSKRFEGSILCREDNLELPLRTKKPTVFAVWNDLFHEDVPVEFILEAYAVMSSVECRQHTFLVLTKRPERMARMLNGAVANIFGPLPDMIGIDVPDNIWHGVTAENQKTANERIHHLLRVPGKRFVSIEPMLGPVDLSEHFEKPDNGEPYPEIHVILLGGESGPNARPMPPHWVRLVRDQCEASGVHFTFKQWGEWMPETDAMQLFDRSTFEKKPQDFYHVYAPPGRGYPNNCEPNRMMFRLGKKRAGRTLDGVIHNNLPWDQQGESK